MQNDATQKVTRTADDLVDLIISHSETRLIPALEADYYGDQGRPRLNLRDAKPEQR